MFQFWRNGSQRPIGIHRIAEGFHHPGIAFTPRAQRTGLRKAHLQNSGITGLARFHATENGAALKLRKVKRFCPIEYRNYPIAMAKDSGRGFRPKIKRNGSTFRQ